MDIANLSIERKWLDTKLFGHPNVKVLGAGIGKVSRGYLPSQKLYGEDDKPTLPYYSVGVVVAKQIEVTGFKMDSPETSQKYEKLKSGELKKVLNFKIESPTNKKKVEFNDFGVLIKQPCILGQNVEAFVEFPPQNTQKKHV